jgi:hypothetical protein
VPAPKTNAKAANKIARVFMAPTFRREPARDPS